MSETSACFFHLNNTRAYHQILQLYFRGVLILIQMKQVMNEMKRRVFICN